MGPPAGPEVFSLLKGLSRQSLQMCINCASTPTYLYGFCYYATCLFNVHYVCILVLHRVEPEAYHAWHHIAIPSLAPQHHSITASSKNECLLPCHAHSLALFARSGPGSGVHLIIHRQVYVPARLFGQRQWGLQQNKTAEGMCRCVHEKPELIVSQIEAAWCIRPPIPAQATSPRSECSE